MQYGKKSSVLWWLMVLLACNALSQKLFLFSRWSRREEQDFYRVISSFGVEFDLVTGRYKWDRFRQLAHLEKKFDDTLTEYFQAFYHMCMRVCKKFKNDDDGEWSIQSDDMKYFNQAWKIFAMVCTHVKCASIVHEKRSDFEGLDRKLKSYLCSDYCIWWKKSARF